MHGRLVHIGVPPLAVVALMLIVPEEMSMAPQESSRGQAMTPSHQIDDSHLARSIIPGERRLEVLTFNVAALPWPIAQGREQAVSRISDQLAGLRRHGHAPQVVVVQEAFISEALEIGRSSGYRFSAFGPSSHSRRPAATKRHSGWYNSPPAFLSSGLAIFSDYELLDIRRTAFPQGACAGIDCLANKGILAARLSIPDLDAPVEIVTTHLNSNRLSGVPEQSNFFAYHEQLQALDRWLARFARPASLRIFAGDFNLGRSQRRLTTFLSHLQRWNARPVTAMGRTQHSLLCSRSHTSCKGPLILSSNVPLTHAKDWQFYQASDRLTVGAVSRRVIFGDEESQRLSDHIGFSVTYSFIGKGDG